MHQGCHQSMFQILVKNSFFIWKKQYSLFVVSLHEFTICGRYFDIKTRKKQVRATMGLGGWGSDHLMTWWSYMFHHESSIFREFSWIFRGSLWGWKLIWPKAATCGHSLGSRWSGHLRPLEWLQVAARGCVFEIQITRVLQSQWNIVFMHF